MNNLLKKLQTRNGQALVEVSLVLALVAIVLLTMLPETAKKVRRPITVVACRIVGGHFWFYDCGAPMCFMPVPGQYFTTMDGACLQSATNNGNNPWTN